MQRTEQSSRRSIVWVFLLVFVVSATGPRARAETEKPKGESALGRAVVRGLLELLGSKSKAPKGEDVIEIDTAELAVPDIAADPAWKATMEQVATIEVGKNLRPHTVNNFCLDARGRVLVACGGDQTEFVRGKRPGDFELKTIHVPAEIKVFLPRGQLVRNIPMSFKPSAIAVLPDGTMFVGGDGRLARLDARGRVVKVVDSPALAGKRPPAADAKNGAKDKKKSQTQADAKADGNSAAPRDEKEETPKDKARREAEKRLREAERKASEMQKKAMERFRREVTGITVNRKDLFVACPEPKGYGYAVWRMDHNLENPVKIVKKLRGCCGQMDIRTFGGDLYVAENGRHRVVRYDRDGKRLSSFGRRDRKAADGFGGCCEPKNLDFSPAGDLYVAESGPPVAIKRFTPDGKFLDVVATPKFETGCVRVTVAVDPLDGRVFLLNGGENKILVFAPKAQAPTHRQVATIKVGERAKAMRIATFCCDGQGRLLAACAPVRRSPSSDASSQGLIRVLAPDGKELEAWKLDFAPQSINVAPDGSIYVGGRGRLAKLDAKGHTVATADSPALEALASDAKEFLPGGSESPAAKAAQLVARLAAMHKNIESYLARQKKRTEAAIERAKKEGDTAEAEALAKRGERIQKTYAAMLKRQEEQAEKAKAEAKRLAELEKKMTPEEREELVKKAIERAETAARHRAAVTGIAVTKRDLFVCCRARTGYAIYRMDHDFKNPKKIADGLRGCCGQLDIQAYEGDVYAAENSRGRVVRFDREGKRLAAWGKRDRKNVEGFGSCCNPMNIRFGPEGEVYTSEASLGRIKRYTRDGKFLGVVGEAKIVPGCKHVAIGVSKDGRRVYLLDITRSQIAVLEKPDKVAGARDKDATSTD